MEPAAAAHRPTISAEETLHRSGVRSFNETQEHLNAINAEGARIQRLLEQLETVPSPLTRELVQELMEATLAFYGHGLTRILQVIRDTGSEGEIVHRRLVDDKVVRGLLLIHDLHPADLEARLRGALEEIRPYLKSHGGNVELIGLANQVATLRFHGTCKSCPSSAVTLELAIRQAIEEACPDLAGFTVEGATGRTQTTETGSQPSDQSKPSWIALENAEQLADGAWMLVQVGGKRIVICNVDGSLYAYRNRCPACNMPFDAGFLETGWLRCPLGHRFDVVRAGRCVEVPSAHLEPFPLLVQDGVIRVSLSL
ncbi:MAG TPA: NifU family protein [Chthoniobacterales bacterium]|jgi:Fe-S cluster biogenesis protein NfuA/nitrite reductase/ring-hydroxylating ferredoxin subunit|nr:NifU family protein [Chthoniobacterales bacterium]